MKNFYDYVKSHPEQLRQFSCKDILFLKLDCPPSFTKSEDWNDYNIFMYILNGRKKMSSREQHWELESKSTVFVRKGGITVERLGPEPFCVLMFFVPDEYLKSFVKENLALISQPNASKVIKEHLIPVHSTPVMQSFFDSILSYFSTRTQPPENLLELKFKELLLNIVCCEHNSKLNSYLYWLSQNEMDDLREVMENNCLYNMQLHEYARLCHRSLSSYKRDFFASFGKAPGRWLLEKRLAYASHLLLNSEKPVMDIALESGFKNLTHFDRVFKQHFGNAPLKYRRQHLTLQD